ncbi:Rieske 2Fe-2S domain-containing protein [Acidiplasma sp.]|nr:Rieske 2Fe-2S domain-containing protein [Acidiplasma sp.]
MWHNVIKDTDLKDGSIKGITIDGKPLLIIKKDNHVYALDLYCTHENTSLDEGFIENCSIVCPNHFASFDIKSGRVTAGPEGSDEKIKDLGFYQTKIEDGIIMVDF